VVPERRLRGSDTQSLSLVVVGTITFRGSPAPGSASGLTRIRHYIREMREAAGVPIMAAIAESRGKRGGRRHWHVLIAGVSYLSIDAWRDEGNRRFGSTRLEVYDGSRNAAFYFIQNVFAGGEFYLEGDLGCARAEPAKPAGSPKSSSDQTGKRRKQ
jgi:hypothetical protein